MSTAVRRAELALAEWRTAPDEELNLEVCQCILTEPRQASDTVKLIKMRLRQNTNAQMLALTLLENLTSICGDGYCGNVIHREIQRSGVLVEMVNIVKARPDMHVRNKILFLIYNWQSAFGGRSAKFQNYYTAYQELRTLGLEYSPHNDFTAPLHTAPQAQHVVYQTGASYPAYAPVPSNSMYLTPVQGYPYAPGMLNMVYVAQGDPAQLIPPGVNATQPNPPGVYATQPNPLGVYATQPNRPGVYATQPNTPGVYATQSNPPAVRDTRPNSPSGLPMSASDIQSARVIAGVVDQMLNAVDHSNPEGLRAEALVELVGSCRDYQKRIEKLVNNTGDGDLLFQALGLNDELQRVLQCYEDMSQGLTRSNTSATVSAVPDANAASPSSSGVRRDNEQSDDSAWLYRRSGRDGRKAKGMQSSNSSNPFLPKKEGPLLGSQMSQPPRAKNPTSRTASSSKPPFVPGAALSSSFQDNSGSLSTAAIGSAQSLPKPPWDIHLPIDMVHPSTPGKSTLWQLLYEERQRKKSWIFSRPRWAGEVDGETVLQR